MTAAERLRAAADKAHAEGNMNEYIRLRGLAITAAQNPEPKLTPGYIVATLVGLFSLLVILTGVGGVIVSAVNHWAEGTLAFVAVWMLGMIGFVACSFILRPTKDKYDNPS